MVIAYFLAFLCVVLFLVVFFLFRRVQELERVSSGLDFAKSSQAVRHGKAMEQLLPFSSAFPFDPSDFRFIGSPIDGLAFTFDEIVFVEFKTGESRLNERQARVKKLVIEKKVRWLEIKA